MSIGSLTDASKRNSWKTYTFLFSPSSIVVCMVVVAVTKLFTYKFKRFRKLHILSCSRADIFKWLVIAFLKSYSIGMSVGNRLIIWEKDGEREIVSRFVHNTKINQWLKRLNNIDWFDFWPEEFTNVAVQWVWISYPRICLSFLLLFSFQIYWQAQFVESFDWNQLNSGQYEKEKRGRRKRTKQNASVKKCSIPCRRYWNKPITKCLHESSFFIFNCCYFLLFVYFER